MASSYADRLAEFEAKANPFYTQRAPNAFDMAQSLLEKIDPNYHFVISAQLAKDKCEIWLTYNYESNTLKDHDVFCIVDSRGVDRLCLKGDRTTFYGSVILPVQNEQDDPFFKINDCVTKINEYLHSHN